ncbi:nickel pincer cofactor biosynthesis protein LarC [Thermodesulfobacteriota bacterium]
MLAYFDCFSGISGDMTLGALLDLGVPLEWLKEQLHRVPLADFDILVSPVQRHGIHAASVQVEIQDSKTSRHYSDIRDLIENSPLSDSVKSTSLVIFKKLAEAEARIHHCPVDHVHLHEVGGVDAIVDIVGTALGLDYLGIKKIVASPVPLGKGFVACSHGKLPLPAPATLGILEGVPVYGTDIPYELVTPTGAAIIRSLAQRFEPLPEMVIARIGYGAGQHDFEDRPNLLRVLLGAESESAVDLDGKLSEDQITIVETCIDDMNPELFGYLMERLFEEGALDVYWIPVHMKKNRPGTMLQVLCKDDSRDRLIGRVLSETTATGVRYYRSRRRLLWRDQLKIKTTYGVIPVKRIQDPGGNIRLVPEYEVCRQIALEQNIALRLVYETVTREGAEKKDE